MSLTVGVDVPPRDRDVLVSWTRSSSIRAGLAQRARVVLLAADGLGTAEIVRRVGLSKPAVIGWKRRYAAEGIAGLQDRAKSGRPRIIDQAEVVLSTLEAPPAELGVTHWSSRLLAKHLGVSDFTVSTIWKKFGLQPWRVETFKFSTDPELEAKIRDVVGLYLNPPDKAIVLCVDEKSQIQALDRTAPVLPIRPGVPEKQTHDYIRHGTTTLFAALEVATGKITDACYPRHRNEEFLRFLKQVAKAYPRKNLHIVCDNYGTHKHPKVKGLASQEPADHPALHPDLGLMAEYGRDLLRHHYPPSDSPRHLHLGQGPHRRDRDLHRRLERSLRTLRMDQDRRPTHPTGHQR